MQGSYHEMIAKINALSLRERALIFVALVVVVQQLWDSYVWLPLSEQRGTTEAQILDTRQSLTQLTGEIGIYSAQLSKDPDQKVRNQLQTLEQNLERVNERTREASSRLVSPAQMAKLLEQMLVAEPTLQLVSLRTMNAEPLIPISEADAGRENVSRYQVYKHVFEVEFDGDYMATLRYLEALEQMPWSFFWDSVDYQVTAYPVSRIVLRLYTLSLSSGFVGVG